MAKRKYSGSHARRKSFLHPALWQGGYNALASGFARKFGGSGSRTKTGSRQNYTSVTNQYDMKGQYRKKRMPRGKRMAWKKFTKKVLAVADAEQGLKTVLFNDQVSAYPLAFAQDWCALHVFGSYGADSAQENGCRDMFDIVAQDTSLTRTKKFVIKSSVIDLTMVNTPNGDLATGNYTLEVDVYVLNHHDKDVNFDSLSSALTQSITETPAIGGGAPITMQSRGATPFALGQFIRNAGISIQSKKKYLLSVGQVATFQYRDPKNHFIDVCDIPRSVPAGGQTELDFKNLTKSFFIIAKCVDPGVSNAALQVRSTRTYTYKSINDRTGNTENVVI